MGRDGAALVFLDSDRLAQDRAAGRDPEIVEGCEQLQLVYLDVNLEGLLVRLHNGCETQFVTAHDARRRLLRLWPEYRKPMPAWALAKRFVLADLRRASKHDRFLRDALILIGLLPRA